MKKKFVITCMILLSFAMIIFAAATSLVEGPDSTKRYRNSITQSYTATISPASATLYHGISNSALTTSAAAVELVSPSSAQLIVQDNKLISSPSSNEDMHLSGLDPSSNYYLYAMLVDSEGVASMVFEKSIPSINYIIDASYNPNTMSDQTDDTITVTFNEDFTFDDAYHDIEIQMGYANETDYETLVLNPSSANTLAPIHTITDAAITAVTSSSASLEIAINNSAVELYDDESQWQVNNPTVSKILVTDSMNSLGEDGGLFFFPTSYDSVAAPPELTGLTYDNSPGISSDYMLLEFNNSVFSDISNDDILITFDDQAGGTYSSADFTLASSDFTITEILPNDIKITFESTGESKINLLKSDSIAKVEIIDNANLIMNPSKKYKKVDMPGQNPQLSDIKFKETSVNGFVPSSDSYFVNISKQDFDNASTNLLEYVTFTTIDPGASATVTGAASVSELSYTLTTTSKDGNENMPYYLTAAWTDTTLLTDLLVNGSTIEEFSQDTYDYSFDVSEDFRVTSVSAQGYDQSTNYNVSYSGSQPGIYVVTITTDHMAYPAASSIYTITYESPISRTTSTSSSSNSSSSSSSSTTNNNVPVEITKSTKQLTTNVSASIDKLLADEEKLNDPEQIDKLVDTLSELTAGVDTREEALQASNDLLDLTTSLSTTLLKEGSDKEALISVLDEIGKSFTGVIAKFDEAEDKIKNLALFTDTIKDVKKELDDTSKLDKAIADILGDTSKSLNRVTLKEAITTEDNTKTFIISDEDVNEADKDSDKRIDELNKLANEYFEDENYIEIKKQVTFDVDSKDDLTNIAFNKTAVENLKKANVKTVNVSVGNTKVSLPTDLLQSDDSFQLVVKKLSPSSKLKREEKVKTNVNEMTNNRKYVDVFMLKNGEELADLDKPIQLTLDTEHFGIDEIDSKTETVTILRYNDESGIWEPVGGIYDPLTNTISVHRIHLSKYTVMKTKKTITDVENEEVKSEVLSLLNKGIIDDKKGNMEDNITREEFVTWLGKSYGLTSSTASAPFEDLDPNSESYKFVASVYEQGIISGRSKDKFGTGDFMTYEEVAVVLSNTLTSLDNKKINNRLTEKLSQMGEDINVSDWAKDEIALVIELGIMDDSVALNADGFISREEAAAIFDKFYS